LFQQLDPISSLQSIIGATLTRRSKQLIRLMFFTRISVIEHWSYLNPERRERRRILENVPTISPAEWCGGINVLINNAGVASFGAFAQMNPEDLERAFQVNVLAPMQLCRGLLPHLQLQCAAHIVNIGSVFGSIGYPGQVTYSATKFALRGFSEALRRELGDTAVQVHYLAPRATRTRFNCAAVEELNTQLAVATDPPECVDASVRRMLETGQPEAFIGWPEKLFARINGILPRLVDRSLARQLPTIRQRRDIGECPASERSLPHGALGGPSA